MSKYMDKDHPDAFVDFPKKDPEPEYGKTKECPVCKGHGGWNLEINAYPLRNHEDTPENRHKYSHFRCSCNHCNGWGYTREDEECDGHEWVFVKNLGRCYNQHKCTKCGKVWNIDSSD